MFEDKKYRLQCKFLINCRFYNLIPVHIQNNFKNIENIHMFSKSGYNILKNNLQKAKQKILNVEILNINNHIQHTKLEINRLKNKLITAGFQKLTALFEAYYFDKLKLIKNTYEIKLDKKLDMLYLKQYRKPLVRNTYIIEKGNNNSDITNQDITHVNTLDNNTQCNELVNVEDRWIVNLSDVTLPKYVINVLKLGKKFNFNDKVDNKIILEMVKNLEVYLNKHTDLKQCNKIRSHFLSIISKFQNRVLSNNSTFEKQLKIDIELTKTFIKNNKDLLITKADKGSATVIIKKSAYLEKMTTLLIN